jgi:hypothetical protein
MDTRPIRHSACGASVVVTAFVLLALVVFAGAAHAQGGTQIQAPLGLIWGWHEKDLIRNGVTITSRRPLKVGGGQLLRVTKTPGTIKDTSLISLVVTTRYGLQKVVWSSTTFRNDKYGSGAKSRYNALKSSLARRYGTPKSYEYSGRKVRKKADEFYLCLHVTGCGNWASYWTTNYIGSILLEIKAFTTGNGYVLMAYEGPHFSPFMRQQKARPNAAGDAL